MSASVGAAAPDFQVKDSQGRTRSLSEFKGKTVVLEWTNRQCPFVRKHYDGGNMQGLQKKAAGDGVVWLSVVSSAPGNQGYVTADEANAHLKAVGAAPAAVLLDADGKLGHLYGAQTTPHMFVVDPQGKVAYAGAIDDKPSTNAKDIAGSRNFIAEALGELKTGKPVAAASTRPYGCSVKYAG